jgi:hypothetical protein
LLACPETKLAALRRDLTLETGSDRITLAEGLAAISTNSLSPCYPCRSGWRVNDPGSMASLRDYREERRFRGYYHRELTPSSIKESSNQGKSGGRLVLDRRLPAITSLVIFPLPLRTPLGFRTMQIIQLRFQVLPFSSLRCRETLSASSSSRADGSSAAPSHRV